MKVIFLDVDGVLNDDSCFEGTGWGGMSRFEKRYKQVKPELLQRLRRIVDATNARIVLSSTWRQHETNRQALTMRLQENCLPTWFSQTPRYDEALEGLGWPNKMSMYYLRGTEIHAWLVQHRALGGEKVEAFVILDDNIIVGNYERPEAHYLRMHFVQTKGSVGLTDDDVEKAIAILGGPA